MQQMQEYLWENRGLKSHTVHLGLKPYKFHRCSATFEQKVGFKSQDSVHLGLKPYGCNECGTTFGQQVSLKSQDSVHLRLKTYEWNECGTTFWQSKLEITRLCSSGIKAL